MTVTEPTPQVYDSSTCTQSNTIGYAGKPDQEVIGIEVVITNTEAPIYNLTGLELGTTGMDQIDNLKIYSTGTSSTFATTTLEHTIPTPSGSTQSIVPADGMSIALVEGTNYIWVAYDIKSDAILESSLDASCTQITIDNGTPVTQEPTEKDPAGDLKVAIILVSNGFEPADNFPESADGSAVTTPTVDVMSNTWTFDNEANPGNIVATFWDGFSGPSNPVFLSQHIQFFQGTVAGSTSVGDYWQVTLDAGNIPSTAVDGFISFATGEGTSSNLNFEVQGLEGSTWVKIGEKLNWTAHGDYSFPIVDMSRFTAYRLIFTGRSDSSSRFHIDDILIAATAPSQSQTYASSSTTQPFGLIDAGTAYSDELVMGVEVVMSGVVTPDSLTGLTLTDNGTVAPTAVKIYSTGISSTFATDTLVYSGTHAGASSFTGVELTDGTNYFWVTYDISPATKADVFDVECTGLVLANAGSKTDTTVTSNGNVLVEGLNLTVKSMSPADKNYVLTDVINTDVYFYGYNVAYQDFNVVDLDGNGSNDWAAGSSLPIDAVTGIRGDPTGSGNLIIDGRTNSGIMGSFRNGNTAFSFQTEIKINSTTVGTNGISWGYGGNSSHTDNDSPFGISHDSIKVGATFVSTGSNLGFNHFRFSYVPSGNNDARGDIYIYRNAELIQVFRNRIGTSSGNFFGDYSGSGVNGGFETTYISVTAGAFAPDPSLTPVIGLEITQTGTELTWTTTEEVGVKEYQVVATETGEVITTVVATGQDLYSVTVPEGVAVKLVVVDDSGFTQTFYPENGDEVTVAYSLTKGWNLITITTENADLTQLLKVTQGGLWSWNGEAYEVITTPKPTQGIWVYATDPVEVTVSGTKSTAEMNISTGWNLVGPVTNCNIPAEALVVYGWNDLYEVIANEQGVLLQAVGYWIFSMQ